MSTKYTVGKTEKLPEEFWKLVRGEYGKKWQENFILALLNWAYADTFIGRTEGINILYKTTKEKLFLIEREIEERWKSVEVLTEIFNTLFVPQVNLLFRKYGITIKEFKVLTSNLSVFSSRVILSSKEVKRTFFETQTNNFTVNFLMYTGILLDIPFYKIFPLYLPSKGFCLEKKRIKSEEDLSNYVPTLIPKTYYDIFFEKLRKREYSKENLAMLGSQTISIMLGLKNIKDGIKKFILLLEELFRSPDLKDEELLLISRGICGAIREFDFPVDRFFIDEVVNELRRRKIKVKQDFFTLLARALSRAPSVFRLQKYMYKEPPPPTLKKIKRPVL